MKKLTSNQIRKTWLSFFEKNGHEIIEAASLIPKDDDSLLWINSGVATLKKFFSGVETPSNKRLTNSQKCLRTLDMTNVGITSRHQTLFEMLGNFSIGDYFKEEAIQFAYDLLTKEFEIEVQKLYITVFDEDEESYNKWIQLGIEKNHIIKNNKDQNFWDLGSGPCGPCTEIFYDRGEKYDPEKKGFQLFKNDIENDRYIEIWNIVFSEYNNDGDGNYSKLERKNIDTGAGLERLACISQDTPTNFETDLFIETIQIIEKNTKYHYSSISNILDANIKTEHFRIIVDHLRATIFVIADGVNPSNKGRGYILKKLIRRIFISLKILNIEKNIFKELINSQIKILEEAYPYLKNYSDRINIVFTKELDIFQKTTKISKSFIKEWIRENKIDAKNLFNLVDTHGLPLEFVEKFRNNDYQNFDILLGLTSNEIENLSKIKINFNEFDLYFSAHKNISKKNNKTIALESQNNALLNLDAKSEFLYEKSSTLSKVLAIFDENFKSVEIATNKVNFLVLDKTPFYATNGGQIHDNGKVNGYEILDVFKGPNGQHIHKIELNGSTEIKLNQLVKCLIDSKKRYKVTAAHSAEHLLHEALKSVIDKNIKQEGAFKSSEKLTFDFYHSEKLKLEDLSSVESFINSVIASKIETEITFKTLDEVSKMKIVALFEEKYKKIEGKLRVVKVGDVSTELCGGTHVTNTRFIEKFMITKLESRGSGTWRIEAVVTNQNCFDYSQKILEKGTAEMHKCVTEMKNRGIRSQEFQDQLVKISEILKLGNNVLREFQESLKIAMTIFQKAIIQDDANKTSLDIDKIKSAFNIDNEYQEHIVMNNQSTKAIHMALSSLVNEQPLKAFILLNFSDTDIKYFAIQNKNTQTFDCESLIASLNEVSGGKGGGKFNFAQGGTDNHESIDKLIHKITERNLN